MIIRHTRLLWIVVMISLITVFAAGCGGLNAIDTTTAGTLISEGIITPTIHVNLTQAGVSYTPAQIRHAYGFDQLTGTGAGQAIAIVDAYGSATIQQDLDTFCARYAIPSTKVLLAYPTGKPSQSNSAWALETALDVEWAHAIAPAAIIVPVVTKTSAISDLLAAVDYATWNTREVSMSWGSGEFSNESSLDTHFNKSGVTLFASTGDSGAGVEWPAVSPYVVSVGGTTLQLDQNGNRLSEIAWSGSGGGQSTLEREPSFQTGWQTSGYRQLPDVSYNADPQTGFPVYSSATFQGQTGWFTVGGTSAGPPQWSAFMAIVNGNRARGISGANGALYALGSRSTFSSYYYDITAGSNGRYMAKAGYDLVTGLGSPLANTLGQYLIGH